MCKRYRIKNSNTGLTTVLSQATKKGDKGVKSAKVTNTQENWTKPQWNTRNRNTEVTTKLNLTQFLYAVGNVLHEENKA